MLAQGIEHVFFLVLPVEGVLSYLGRIGYCYLPPYYQYCEVDVIYVLVYGMSVVSAPIVEGIRW